MTPASDRRGFSHGHGRFDMRVGLIILEFEMFVFEAENVVHRRIDAHGR